MRITSSMATLLAPVALFTAVNASANETPNPREIYIQSINYNGTGCPLGTVAENVSPDGQAFTLTFSDYIAEASQWASPRDARKNCQITLNLNVPSGFQYTVASFDYRGFLDLQKGTKANYSTSYYFQGDSQTVRTNTSWDTLRPVRGVYPAPDWNGDIYGPFSFTQKVGITSLVWSRCGVQRALNVNTSMAVSVDRRNHADAEAFIGTDSIDGNFKQKFALMWRRCR
ncbi:MAG: DUF4360 domain-containing protein [Oligoflexus sp.]